MTSPVTISSWPTTALATSDRNAIRACRAVSADAWEPGWTSLTTALPLFQVGRVRRRAGPDPRQSGGRGRLRPVRRTAERAPAEGRRRSVRRQPPLPCRGRHQGRVPALGGAGRPRRIVARPRLGPGHAGTCTSGPVLPWFLRRAPRRAAVPRPAAPAVGRARTPAARTRPPAQAGTARIRGGSARAVPWAAPQRARG